MEITQSAGNLKALGSPEAFLFLFLFLGNRSQISLWLIGLKLTDKPVNKRQLSSLPAVRELTISCLDCLQTDIC